MNVCALRHSHTRTHKTWLVLTLCEHCTCIMPLSYDGSEDGPESMQQTQTHCPIVQRRIWPDTGGGEIKVEIKKNNKGQSLFSCFSFSVMLLWTAVHSRSRCDALLAHLNTMKPSLMLLVTPMLFRPWEVQVSAGRKGSSEHPVTLRLGSTIGSSLHAEEFILTPVWKMITGCVLFP